MAERSMYIWNAAATSAGRRAKRDQLVGIGCTEVFIKGFGDDGVAWIPGVPLPSFARDQWSDAYAADYAPLRVTLWGYPWPKLSDIASCVLALKGRWSDRVVLNPETEWRWKNSNVNPWNSLDEANTAARKWMQDLKAACLAAFGKVPSFWISSCPTWADFPYEGFVAECDGALPEHYFPDNLMAPDGETGDEAGEDMVEGHIRRAGRAMPCVPVITCCGEYKDGSKVGPYDPYSVVGLAENGLSDMPELDGFCGWEAGNASFQAEAMRQVYSFLPEDIVVKEDTGFQHAPGFLNPIVDTFDWGGAGIVTYRKIRAYNDQDQKTYEREWSAENGYTPWVVVNG